MPAHYLPVSRSMPTIPEWESSMPWLSPPKYFHYPYLLVTPFVTGMTTTREDFGKADLHIYADSGGFQIATQNLKVSSLDVLRWQEEIADVALTLDTPPFSYSTQVSDGMYPREYFLRCMEKSVHEANIMYEAQQNEKMELWAVLQGKNLDELHEWYKEQTKEHQFKGYSIALTGVVNMVAGQYAWIDVMSFAKEVNTPIHWLGKGEPLISLVVAKLSQVTKQKYTYDTSSSSVGPRFGKYYDPYFQNLIWLAKDEKDRANLDSPPCFCPVCQKHTIEEIINGNHLLQMHNLFVLKTFNEYCNIIVKDDELFMKNIRRILKISGRINEIQIQNLENKIENLIYGNEKKTTDLSEFW